MQLNINQIKELLKIHNYLTDKSIDISTIRTGHKYSFTCNKGHVFESFPRNVFQSGKFGCPICSGRRTLAGYNDLWTTHPHIAEKLKFSEEGYTHSCGSNKKLWWVCPDCGHEEYQSPNKMVQRKCLCKVCGSDISYPEKFISNLLDQCIVLYEREKYFDWSENKRYDFYIPLYDCIVEVHGNQHYEDNGFSYLNGKTLIEEQINDERKEYIAKKYGRILNYIIIDCRKSDKDWIRNSVLKSGLLEVLYIFPYTINWEECNTFATSNIVKMICEAYETGTTRIETLCTIFHLSKNSIREKLKQGNKLGWCSYTPEKARNQARKNPIKKGVVMMDMDENDIREFDSIKEAENTLSIGHIWDCLVGRRNSAGGYKWRYKSKSGERVVKEEV